MNTLEDTVKQIVNDFVTTGALFTALDVSNEVKKTMPFARHREVRDVVRSMYADIQVLSYGRTPISVTLEDGTVVEALLYHSLADSWDLDAKYDAQKRIQTSPKSTDNSNISMPTATISTSPLSSLPVTQAPVVPSAAPSDPKQMWDNLFDNAKLFP